MHHAWYIVQGLLCCIALGGVYHATFATAALTERTSEQVLLSRDTSSHAVKRPASMKRSKTSTRSTRPTTWLRRHMTAPDMLPTGAGAAIFHQRRQERQAIANIRTSIRPFLPLVSSVMASFPAKKQRDVLALADIGRLRDKKDIDAAIQAHFHPSKCAVLRVLDRMRLHHSLQQQELRDEGRSTPPEMNCAASDMAAVAGHNQAARYIDASDGYKTVIAALVEVERLRLKAGHPPNRALQRFLADHYHSRLLHFHLDGEKSLVSPAVHALLFGEQEEKKEMGSFGLLDQMPSLMEDDHRHEFEREYTWTPSMDAEEEKAICRPLGMEILLRKWWQLRSLFHLSSKDCSICSSDLKGKPSFLCSQCHALCGSCAGKFCRQGLAGGNQSSLETRAFLCCPACNEQISQPAAYNLVSRRSSRPTSATAHSQLE